MNGLNDLSLEVPIVFPKLITHSNLANELGKIGKIKSAGFCYIDTDGLYYCLGRSESLGIDSNPMDDACILNSALLY